MGRDETRKRYAAMGGDLWGGDEIDVEEPRRYAHVVLYRQPNGRETLQVYSYLTQAEAERAQRRTTREAGRRELQDRVLLNRVRAIYKMVDPGQTPTWLAELQRELR